MAVRTYGIPRIIESHEIFLFNKGMGKLKVKFSGGIPDPKYLIPATYSTGSEFEQLVIENSPLFGKKVFRYGPNGQVIAAEPINVIAERINSSSAPATKKMGRPSAKAAAAAPEVEPGTKVYDRVETIGQATEVLLDLGARADELTGREAVVSAMMRMKVAFPNLKFD